MSVESILVYIEMEKHSMQKTTKMMNLIFPLDRQQIRPKKNMQDAYTLRLLLYIDDICYRNKSHVDRVYDRNS